MSSQSQTNTSQLASSQPELLYGNGHFLVRLWTLQPQQEVHLVTLNGEQARQGFLISGNISVSGPTESKPLAMGQHWKTNGLNDSGTLLNSDDAPATFLEIIQGSGLQQVPLPEVTDTRPWGSFTVLKDEPKYKLKQLLNTPGNRLSLQRHQKREEHWVIIAGNPEITLDDAVYTPHAGDYIRIPLHSWHRLSNPAKNTDNVELIELQLGVYFGEDDIERRQDDYGRV